MHIFLTGSIQVGKSTIIRKVVEELNIDTGGFKTAAGNYSEDGGSDIFILGYNEPLKNCNTDNRVAHRFGKNYPRAFASYPEIFDTIGCKLLESNNCQLIIMDELGFMEADAFEFQRAVLSCLDGSIPVLGVIKPMETSFLNSIRLREKTHIIQVDELNRDGVFHRVLEYIR